MKNRILILMGAAFIMACHKEKPMATHPGAGDLSPRNMPATALDENGVGEWHNYYLDLTYQELENDITLLGYENFTEADIDNSMGTIINAMIKGDDSTYHRENAFVIGRHYLNGDGITDNLLKARRQIAQFNISATLKNGLNSLWSRCDTVTTKAGATSISLTFKAWANANQNLTTDEKQIAIGTADVFESSFAYWDDNIDKWNALLSHNQGGDNSPQTKASIGGADAAGFTTGALIGAYGGSVTIPGVGTCAGWLGGGIAGGLTGSVYTAVSNLWDWMFG